MWLTMLVNLVNSADDVVADAEDAAEEIVLDVVLTALDVSIASIVSIALDAPIALVIVSEELSSYLAQKDDYLRRRDCPCILECRGSSM
jgi:hypothetical protein